MMLPFAADLMLPGLVVPPAGLPQVQKGDLCAIALVGNRYCALTWKSLGERGGEGKDSFQNTWAKSSSDGAEGTPAVEQPRVCRCPRAWAGGVCCCGSSVFCLFWGFYFVLFFADF